MSDPTNDIDALLLRFHPERTMGAFIDDVSCARYRAAITALVAERDGIRKRVAELEKELKHRNEAYEELRWQSVEKSWSQPPADRERELRERLVESALQGVNVSGLHRSEAELIGKASVWMVDSAIAAMRKGDSDGK